MQRAGQIVFHAFLCRVPTERQRHLLGLLPEEELALLRTLPYSFLDPTQGISQPSALLKKAHASWLAPFIRTLPENDIRLLLASLEEPQRAGLKKDLLFSNHFPTLNPLAMRYVQQLLTQNLIENQKEILPLECLPEHPLNELLNLNKEELSHMINLLGIHDVAFELRHIIETAKIKQVQNALDPQEQNYLKKLLQQQELITFKRMGLDKWDGNVANLKKLIHQRGLNRIGKSLFGLDDSLVWHLSRRLSTADAATLHKLCSDLKNTQAVTLLTRQIMEMITLVKKDHP